MNTTQQTKLNPDRLALIAAAAQRVSSKDCAKLDEDSSLLQDAVDMLDNDDLSLDLNFD